MSARKLLKLNGNSESVPTAWGLTQINSHFRLRISINWAFDAKLLPLIDEKFIVQTEIIDQFYWDFWWIVWKVNENQWEPLFSKSYFCSNYSIKIYLHLISSGKDESDVIVDWSTRGSSEMNKMYKIFDKIIRDQ